MVIFAELQAPPDSRLLGEAQAQRAESLAMRGEWQRADTLYRKLEEDFAGNRRTWDQHFADAPTILLTRIKTGAPREALSELQHTHGQSTRNKGPDHYDTAELAGLMGLAHAELGETEAARALLDEAVPVLVEGDRQARISGEPRVDQRTRLRFIVEAYLKLLSDGATAATAPEVRRARLDVAFRYAAYLQSEGVQAAIARSAARGAARNPQLATLVRTEQDAQLRLNAAVNLLAASLTRESNQANTAVVKARRRQVSELRLSRLALRAEITRRFPAYAELTNPSPPSIARVRQLLERHEAMVAFYVAERHTFVWAIPQTGPIAFVATDLGLAELVSRVERLRRALEPDARTLAEIPDFDVAAAHDLYRRLLAPVSDGWRSANTLLVVTHGPLGYLPISILPVAASVASADGNLSFDRYRLVRWIARDHAVTLLPSVSSLEALRGVSRRADDTRRPFIGFGDPIFGPIQAESGSAAKAMTSRGKDVRRIEIAMRNQPRTQSHDSASLEALPRLPETSDELNAIASSLGADVNRDLYLGLMATEERVKQSPLADYRIVAFATHGLAAGDLDGLLTMEEVLGLQLDTDWVVLSACNTAAGQGAGAEAVSGLGRAFFYAGSRALLVSHWPVHSQATTTLMTDLFRNQGADVSLSRANALRAAKLHLLGAGAGRDPESGRPLYTYAHPIFWAPFTLVGDGGE